MRPAISIIMPVLNAERHLQAALDSLAAQTCVHYELIIVDDGSSDATPEILRRAAAQDDRIVIQAQPSTGGIARALNIGLDHARGAFIARQDADDVSRPTRFESQIRFLEHHHDVGLLGTWYDVLTADGRRRATFDHPLQDEPIRWKLLCENAFCHSSVMLRADVVSRHRLRYDERLDCAQDYDLWVRLLSHTRGANLPSPLVGLREHDGRMSVARSQRQRLLASRISRDILHRVAGLKLPTDIVVAIRDRWPSLSAVIDAAPSAEPAEIIVKAIARGSPALAAGESDDLWSTWVARIRRTLRDVRGSKTLPTELQPGLSPGT
jgi:glycosyltransferase involved in cell wall biosynthesis